MEKKFLDVIGVTLLWDNIKNTYPNNNIFTSVINAIDDIKADREELKNYLSKEEYVAGESGGTIDLSNFLTETEAKNMFATLEQIYPVGAIYISMSSTSPEVLFNFGVWQQIQDVFLLASNVSGITGGEAEHTLTVTEMPSHSHSFLRHQFDNNDLDNGSDVYGVSNKTIPQTVDDTGFTGEGMPHNNMPPYLTVYMWQGIE